jgi:hypothetical protein
MTVSRTIVLVAGGRSADRSIALERLLRDEASRQGWEPRLEIRLGGIGLGSGKISDAGHAALEAHGIEAAGAVCPDLERRRELFEGAEIIVCDCGEAADALIDWTETEEAEFVCVDDLRAEAADEDESETPIGQDVDTFAALAPEVLRRIVAAR